MFIDGTVLAAALFTIGGKGCDGVTCGGCAAMRGGGGGWLVVGMMETGGAGKGEEEED